MSAIRVFFSYKHIDDPWGGANNFVRALWRALSGSRDLSGEGVFSLSHDPEAPFDILFMNQLGRGPGGGGGHWRLAEIDALLRKNPGARLVVRAINLRAHSHAGQGLRAWWGNRQRDRESLALLARAGVVIFQSAYQKSFFEKAGWRGGAHRVIHNGADALFSGVRGDPPPLPGLGPGEPLRLLCSVMGPRKTKRHDLILAFSRQPGVVVEYAGQWPEGLDAGAVRMLGTLDHAGVFAALALAHYFLHPAVCDPCPNAMIEALCAGVPVIYNPGPGSGAELAGDCGLAIDESDIEGTLRRAREGYADLSARAMAGREAHGMGRAAAIYAEVFSSAASRSASHREGKGSRGQD